jgi:hypothetical protein
MILIGKGVSYMFKKDREKEIKKIKAATKKAKKAGVKIVRVRVK